MKTGKYRHYHGKYYDVLGLAKHTETKEDYVVYRGLYDDPELGPKPLFIRSQETFQEEVIVDGKKVPRFERLDDHVPQDSSINFSRIGQLLHFLKEVEKLKFVERAIPLSDHHRYENTAEHSWHVALVILLLKELYPQANMAKMLSLALIHDLVEIYAGDTPLFDEEGRKTKAQRELESAKKLFSQLPSDIGSELLQLFGEYEQKETEEAKIVTSSDELQALLQNIISEGKAWQDHHLDQEWLLHHSKKKMLDNTVFLQLWDYLHQEIQEKKLTWRG